MLVIVDVLRADSSIPSDALQNVDLALEAAGLRKQIRSVLVPEKHYSTTYEASAIEKSAVEKILAPIAEANQILVSVEIEESVSFP